MAEVMTVLLLVGILASLGVPSLNRVLARARRVAALNQLALDLSYARMLAVRSGNRAEVLFVNEGSCGAPRSGRFSADGYHVIVHDPAPRTVKVTRLRDVGGELCLEANNDRDIFFGSRGLLLPFENRTVWARSGGKSDSLTVSVLGRVRRRY